MKKFKYKINGKEYKVAVGELEDNLAKVEVNGTTYEVELEKKKEEEEKPKLKRPAVKATAAPAGGDGGLGAVKSPLPGIIVGVLVSVGDSVTKGQNVATLEAMKMENAIAAPINGKVTAIHVNEGDSILEGVTILTIG